MRALITISILTLLVACNAKVDKQASSDTPTTSSTKMEKLLPGSFNQKLVETKNAQLIDVRTPAEVAAGAIPGAVNIDFYSDQFETKMEALDPNRPVMVYCKSGGRSGKTANMLKGKGFIEVYDLKGGYSAWSSK